MRFLTRKRKHVSQATYYSASMSAPQKSGDSFRHGKVRSHKGESLYDWVSAAIFSLICVIVAFIFVFRIVGVQGTSMYPTLKDKERLVITTFNYHPRRGDIVIIDRYPEEPLVKRIIAVGGDKIQILPDAGKVVLNGVILDEAYTHGERTDPNDFGTDVRQVPKGKLVVMGDNREVSKDSRRNEIGYVDEQDVVGKVILRFSPVSRLQLF